MTHLAVERVSFTHNTPVYPTPFAIGEAAASVLALQGMMLDVLRGKQQPITVDCHSAAASTHAVTFQQQNGFNWQYNDPDYPTTDFYLTADNRWIFLHGGYPRLRDGILDILDVPNSRHRVAQAVAQWEAHKLEETIAEAGLCAAIARSHKEWLAHPQGLAVSQEPLIRLTRLTDSAPKNRRYDTPRVLKPLRVLDFTHVIAGPTATRGLAQMGADVLHLSSPYRPRILPFAVDTNHGKRNAYLELSTTEGCATAAQLVRDGDVFVQSYRPGALARYGLSDEEMAQINPQIITVNLNCYGHRGPWKDRPGFEQLAQTVTGMAVAQGGTGQPVLGPTYPNDYLSGYLATLGVLMALERQRNEGGAWRVDVSLCRTATWLQQLGSIADYQTIAPPDEAAIARCMVCEEGPFGELRYFNSALELAQTPMAFAMPAMPLGAHRAEWW
ncbi:TPA: CoA transferase [Kluyvera ascorbata]|nr:CoA transferase [Kluyvera ascorbata]